MTTADGKLKDLELRSIDGQPCGVAFECPGAQCTQSIWIPFARDGHSDHRWKWDGQYPNMTLSPSLLNHCCGAHFFVEQGRLRWC